MSFLPGLLSVLLGTACCHGELLKVWWKREDLSGGQAGSGGKLSFYPASWHGKCIFLPWGRPALALRAPYELSYPFMATNCDFGIRLSFSELARWLRSLEDMFLVTRTQGPKYARFFNRCFSKPWVMKICYKISSSDMKVIGTRKMFH